MIRRPPTHPSSSIPGDGVEIEIEVNATARDMTAESLGEENAASVSMGNSQETNERTRKMLLAAIALMLLTLIAFTIRVLFDGGLTHYEAKIDNIRAADDCNEGVLEAANELGLLKDLDVPVNFRATVCIMPEYRSCEGNPCETIAKVNGNSISAELAESMPLIKALPFDNVNNFYKLEYTIVMIDADVPTKTDPVERSRRLWVISRINGTALRQGLERHDFDVLSAFAAPTLPLGSGRHRVAFLLYQHKDGTPLVASRMNDRKRGNFNPQRWALEHHLDLEGFTFFTVNANT